MNNETTEHLCQYPLCNKARRSKNIVYCNAHYQHLRRTKAWATKEVHFRARASRFLREAGCIVHYVNDSHTTIPTGYPDLTVVLPTEYQEKFGGPVLFLELKVNRYQGGPNRQRSPQQVEMADWLESMLPYNGYSLIIPESFHGFQNKFLNQTDDRRII